MSIYLYRLHPKTWVFDWWTMPQEPLLAGKWDKLLSIARCPVEETM